MDKSQNKFARPPKKPPVASDFWYDFDKRFQIRSKKKWSQNRKPPKDAEPLVPLKKPVSWIYFTFGSNLPGERWRNCASFTSGLGPRPTTLQVLRVMQDLQALEFKKGRREVKYNFMIGGDGVVYEGRGWNYRPSLPKKYYYHANKCLYIAYIGHWELTPPSPHLFELRDKLLKIGIENHTVTKKHMQISLAFPNKYSHELHRVLK